MKKTIIGKNFKKLRLFKNLNQTEFAELFEVTRSAIGSYEEGRAEPKLETLIKVADHFKLNIDDIVRKELTVNQIAGFKYPMDKGIQNDRIYSEMRAISEKIVRLEKAIEGLKKKK